MYDVCIIGSGPAGLASALICACQGLRVALLESGDEAFSSAAQALSEAEIDTPEAHAPMDNAVQRGLGGTSALWGGRCVPLDAVDFAERPYVNRSEWPFSHAVLEAYYDEACQFLDAGPARFNVMQCVDLPAYHQLLSEEFVDSPDVLATQLERWSGSPHAWKLHREAVIAQPLIDLLPQTTCVGWTHGTLDSPVREAKVVDKNGQHSTVKARSYVLAAGGIESTRLILNSVGEPDGLRLAGNQWVGKYYMGHPSGKIARIRLNGDPKKTIYGFETEAGTYIRRRISFSAEKLIQHKLLNISFWLDNPPIADSTHQSGVLSAAFLALTAPGIGSKLAPAAIKERMIAGHDLSRWPHIINCINSPLATLKFVTSFAYKRYVAKPRLPGFFTYSASNSYALHYHAEQAPNENSQITLSESRDKLGLRRARIALRWSEQDIDSIIRAHQVLDEELRRTGIGKIDYTCAEEDRPDAALRQAVDGFHQMGTLRMARSAQDGVTNQQGQVFGVPNLYVASSAVFPTSGQANPTLAMVALAMRQARYIAGTLKEAR